MKPTIKFGRSLVAVLVDEVVHVMLELAAPPAANVQRAPLDVVVVLDRSGSMIGSPLEAVTMATAQLLRLAGPDDRMAVVAFDDNVQLVLPLAHHEPDAAGRAVRAVQSGGSTNLSGGWLKGLELLASSLREGALRRIIVLTDGHSRKIVREERQHQLLAIVDRAFVPCCQVDDGHQARAPKHDATRASDGGS